MTPHTGEPKRVNVALQGGGAHGAYSWGVLDRLIEDGRLSIDGLCGTSAGAMNAVVYGYAKMVGGVDHARQRLEDFWRAVSRAGRLYAPVRNAPLERWLGTRFGQAASFAMFDAITRIFSPYQLNPFDFNPLRDILLEHVDFDRIHACKCTKMFVCATSARTGKPRIFGNRELTADAVLASACLPFLFRAVEIDGEDYWDGGYLGNPALYPMIYGTSTLDFLIVHVNPMVRDEKIRDAPGIFNRVNEVTFNSSLVAELRTIAFVQKIIDQGWLKPEYEDRLKRIRVHAIRSDADLSGYSMTSKFDADWGFLTTLRDLGRARAGAWLDAHFEQVGHEQTVDLRAEYL